MSFDTGKVLSELNYVHPFREGNGRAQDALLTAIGREHGHEVDFTVITKPRMIEASIATTNDPSSPAMKHIFEDAIDPNRQEAIRAAFVDFEMRGENAFELNVRTARPGEQVSGFSGTISGLPALLPTTGLSPSIAPTFQSGCPMTIP